MLPLENPIKTEPMKRYALFAWEHYYELGGFDSLIKTSDDYQELAQWALDNGGRAIEFPDGGNYVVNRVQIFDLDTRELMLDGEFEYRID